MGALASLSIPLSYLVNGALAGVGAALLAFGWRAQRPSLGDARP
jgi:hypothetical protein